MKEIAVKKIPVSPNMYVLCVPDENSYYSFYLCHNKASAVLRLYGSTAVKDPGDDVLEYLAMEGFRAAQNDYIKLHDFLEEREV